MQFKYESNDGLCIKYVHIQGVSLENKHNYCKQGGTGSSPRSRGVGIYFLATNVYTQNIVNARYWTFDTGHWNNAHFK